MESCLAVPAMTAPAMEVAAACEACPADGADLAAMAQLEARQPLQYSSKKPLPAIATKAPVTMPSMAVSKAHETTAAAPADIATALSSPRHALLCSYGNSCMAYMCCCSLISPIQCFRYTVLNINAARTVFVLLRGGVDM